MAIRPGQWVPRSQAGGWLGTQRLNARHRSNGAFSCKRNAFLSTRNLAPLPDGIVRIAASASGRPDFGSAMWVSGPAAGGRGDERGQFLGVAADQQLAGHLALAAGAALGDRVEDQ